MGILDNMGGGNFQMGLLGLAGLGSLFENRGPRYTTNIAEATTPRENPFMAQIPGQMALIARQEQERRRNDLLTQMQQEQLAEKQRQQAARAGFVASLPSNTDPSTRALAEIDPGKAYEYVFGAKTPKRYVVDGNLVDESGKPVFTAQPKAPAPTNLAKLQAELDAMPKDDPRRGTWQSMIRKESERDPYVIGQINTPNGPAMVAAPRPGTSAAGPAMQTGGVGNPQLGPGVTTAPGTRILAQGPSAQAVGKVQDLEAGAKDFRAASENFKQAMADRNALSAWMRNPSDPTATRVNTSYMNMVGQLRVLYNTGVLQPGEWPMLEKALQDPSSARGVFASDPAVAAQLDELNKMMDQRVVNARSTYYNEKPTAPPSEVATKTASEADIAATMKATLLPRGEVIKRLRAKGYKVEGE